jgi:hypothetical protein
MRQASEGAGGPVGLPTAAVSGLRLAFLGAVGAAVGSIMGAPYLLGLSSFIALDPHTGSGGGHGRRSSILRRRMSAKSDRGTATRPTGTPRVAPVADDPGADLDQLLAQGRQRTLLDLLQQCDRAQEVGEVVG